MADRDLNQSGLRTRKFKGYIQFNDPADTSHWYRLEERQSLTVNFNYTLTHHYNDAGLKFLDPAGHNHTFATVIKLTSDMIDDATGTWGGTSGATAEGTSLSYWIEKLQRYEPVLMTFITTSEALSGPSDAPFQSGDGTEKIIKIKFTGQPNSFTFDMGTDASSTVSVNGTITDILHIKRQDP